MKKNSVSNYVDDFLHGSITVYNYNPIITNNYCIYCQAAGFQKTGPRYYNEIARFPNYMVNMTTKGRGKITIDGTVHELTAGSLVFLHNENHHVLEKVAGEEWEFDFIHIFESEMVSKIYQSLAGSSGYIVQLPSTGLFERTFAEIIRLLRRKETNYEIEVSIEIYKLLMRLTALKPLNPNHGQIDSEVGKVSLFMKEHFSEKITMEDILSQTYYSKNHIERLFKKNMHTTMRDYLYSLRLNRAEELLLSTNKSLKEIAVEVGCGDYRTLHYLFRTKINCTPNEFRKAKKSK